MCVCVCVFVCGRMGGVKEYMFIFSLLGRNFLRQMNLERIVSSRLNPLKVSVLIVDHDSFLIGQRSHDLCLHVVTLRMSVGLSSHSRRNVCIFDKASNTQHIVPFPPLKYSPSIPPPPSHPPHTHTHTQPP